MFAAATLHQEWLVRMHCHLDTQEVKAEGSNAKNKKPCRSILLKRCFHVGHGVHIKPTMAGNRKYMKIPTKLLAPSRWRYTKSDWESICHFARNLRRRQEDGNAIAFCELAVAFHMVGHRIQGDYSSHHSCYDLHDWPSLSMCDQRSTGAAMSRRICSHPRQTDSNHVAVSFLRVPF